MHVLTEYDHTDTNENGYSPHKKPCGPSKGSYP